MRIAALLALCLDLGSATLRVHALFADHVVLQTTDDGGPGARLSGTAKPHERVTLTGIAAGGDGAPLVASHPSASSFSFSAVADTRGTWELPVALGSGGPYILTLRADASADVLTVRNALVGDVYLCSG